jgi:hypothetical protein
VDRQGHSKQKHMHRTHEDTRSKGSVRKRHISVQEHCVAVVLALIFFTHKKSVQESLQHSVVQKTWLRVL